MFHSPMAGFYNQPIQSLINSAQEDEQEDWNAAPTKKRRGSELGSPAQGTRKLPKPMIIQIKPRPSQIVLARAIKATFPSVHVVQSRELRSPDEIFIQAGDEGSRTTLFNVVNLNYMFPNATIQVRNPLPRQNSQPSYVITNVPHSFTLADIKHELEFTNKMPAKDVSRIVSRATNQATKLIRVFTANPQHALSAVKHGVYLGFQKHRCEESTQKPTIQQCFKCQGYGHMAKECAKELKCLRCSGEHSLKDCKQPKEEPTCANCGEKHASIYKGCKVYQAEVNKVIEKKQTTKTYAMAATQPITNSIQIENVVVFIADLLVKLRSVLHTISSSDVIAAVSQCATLHFKTPINGEVLHNHIEAVRKPKPSDGPTGSQHV